MCSDSARNAAAASPAASEPEKTLTTHFGATRRGGRLQLERADLGPWEPGTPFRVVRESRRRHVLQRLTEAEAGDPATRRRRGIYHVSRRQRGQQCKSVIWLVSRAFQGGALVQIRVLPDRIEIRELETRVERQPDGRFRLKLAARRIVVVGGFDDAEHVRRTAAQVRDALRRSQRFAVGDTFSGIGGTHLGFAQAQFETAWAVDWSPRAEQLFRLNFPDVPYYATDIRTFSPERNEHGPIDGLISTFPCDDVSRLRRGVKRQEGSGLGLTGSQSGLLRESLRLIAEVRPRYFIFLENTQDLPRINDGRDLAFIKAELARLGYPYFYDIVLSALGWVPRLRPRWYGVAFSADVPFTLPVPNRTPTRLGDILQPDDEVPESYNWTPGMVQHFLRRLDPAVHRRDNDARIAAGKRCRNFRPIIAGADSPYAATLTENGWKGNETSVIIRRPSGVLRKLTQREMARYMGFPDSYLLPDTLSWTGAHQLFGNSVVCKVIREFGERIRSALIEWLVQLELPRAASRPAIQVV